MAFTEEDFKILLAKTTNEQAAAAARQELAAIKAQRAQEQAARAIEKAADRQEKSAAKIEQAANQQNANATEERIFRRMSMGFGGSMPNIPGMQMASRVGGTAMRLGGNMFDIMFPTLSKMLTSVASAWKDTEKQNQEERRQMESNNETLQNISDNIEEINAKLGNISDYLLNLKSRNDEASKGGSGGGFLDFLENVFLMKMAQKLIPILPQIIAGVAVSAAGAAAIYGMYRSFQKMQNDETTQKLIEQGANPAATMGSNMMAMRGLSDANKKRSEWIKEQQEKQKTAPVNPDYKSSWPSWLTPSYWFGKKENEADLPAKTASPSSGMLNGFMLPGENAPSPLIQQASLESGDDVIKETLSFNARNVLFNAEKMMLSADNFMFETRQSGLGMLGRGGGGGGFTSRNAPSEAVQKLMQSSGSGQTTSIALGGATISPALKESSSGYTGGGGGYNMEGAQGPGLGGNGSTQEAMEFFISKGWTKEQAAGIVGNLQAESGANLKINAVGDGGKAYGIAQWHPDRQALFEKQYGKPIREANFKEQLEFVNWELNNSESMAGSLIKQAKTAEEAAVLTDKYYERSAGLHTGRRIANANALVNSKTQIAEKSDSSTSSMMSPAEKPRLPAGALEAASIQKGSALSEKSTSVMAPNQAASPVIAGTFLPQSSAGGGGLSTTNNQGDFKDAGMVGAPDDYLNRLFIGYGSAL